MLSHDQQAGCYVAVLNNDKVNDFVDQLLSVPKLGLEHAAYHIEIETGVVWIDSPSAFNRELVPVNAILFTHYHFMGASNQYRQLWNTKVWLDELDAKHRLAAHFDVDQHTLLMTLLPMT